MHELIVAFIILGAILMVGNIYFYAKFLVTTRDVLSTGSKRDQVWKVGALILLVFFLIGYLYVGLLTNPDMMMALILFFGSVFVAIVLTVMFNLLDTVKTRSIDIAEILVGVIDARDPNLNGHSRHVQNLTMLFYQHLPKHMKNELNPVSLEFAALMHDVGKLGVPESILNKPGKLDDEEWKVVRRHPDVGVEILNPMHTFDDIVPWIRFHHERVDGKGYHSISGREIPLAAKMIAIADTYSAITMRRAYKAPKTHEEAVGIIQSVEGTQLDRELVEIFLSIPKEELEKCIPEMVKY